MKLKTLVALIVVLIVLGGVVGFLANKRGASDKKTVLGRPLFKDLRVNDIAYITIQGPGQKRVRLKRANRLWGVVDRYGYPADFGKIKDLVRKIGELKVGRSFEARPEVLARLKLVSPLKQGEDAQHQGILISFKDKDGNELGAVIIGKQHRSTQEQRVGTGQYVRFTRAKVAYLVDKNFPFIETNPKGWLDKDLIKVQPENIRRISCTGKDGELIYSFERQDEGGKLEATGPLKGRHLNKSKLNRLERAIAFLSLSDVVDPSVAPKRLGIDDKVCVTYELFDGVCYKIFPGVLEKDGKKEYYLKIKVDYVPPQKTATKAQGDRGRDKKGQEQHGRAETQLRAKQLNERLSPWVYVVTGWTAQAFATDDKELVDEKSAQKTKSK